MKTKQEFAAAVLSCLRGAEVMQMEYLDIDAGNLHRLIGEYPGKNHRMPVCCDAMRDEMQDGDTIGSNDEFSSA